MHYKVHKKSPYLKSFVKYIGFNLKDYPLNFDWS